MDKLPTYQELLAINRQLVAENEQLRKENAKLGELVNCNILLVFGRKSHFIQQLIQGAGRCICKEMV